MAKMPPSEACLVCGGRSDGAHFGAVDACRACTAFFRRIITCGREYSCLEGGHCVIDPYARNICRGCRFERCLAVGMQAKNVQKRRDGRGPIHKLPNCTPSTSVFTPDTTTNSLIITEEMGMAILRRIHTQYSQLKGVRKLVHQGGVNRPPRAAIFADVEDLNLREARLISDFVFSSFPAELAEVEAVQQKVLFQLFFPTFLSFECAFLTAQAGEPGKMFLSNGDYMDSAALSSFYDTKKDGKQVDTEQAVKVFSSTFLFFTEHCTLPIMERGLDEYEFYALAALCLWDYDHASITVETREVGQGIRKEIIGELIFYYRYIRRYTDESERLAELMLFITPIQRMGKRLVEDIEVGLLFKIYDYDEALQEFLNIRSKIV